MEKERRIDKHLVLIPPQVVSYSSPYDLFPLAESNEWNNVKKKLITDFTLVNFKRYNNGQSLFELAINQKNVEVATFLLEYGAETFKPKNNSNETLFEYAKRIFSTNETFIQQLTQVHDAEMVTSFIGSGSYIQALEILQKNETLINYIHPLTRKTFLHLGVETGDFNFVQSLLKFQLIDVALRNAQHKTALQLAKSSGFLDIYKLLSDFEEQKKNELKKTFQPSNPTLVKLFKDIELFFPNAISYFKGLSSKRVNFTSHLASSCFLISNLMSKKECQHYINEAEKVGFSSLEDEYPSNYRSNDRVLVYNKNLAKSLWLRIAPHLQFKDVVRIHPLDFGNEGVWRPVGLNACFKFGRYRKGAFFSPHIDGPWIPSWDLASVYTVVIYLNDNFQGGQTELLECPDFFSDSHQDVNPVTGTALIFRHDFLHSATPVISGTKYIIRTEIMFQRVDQNMIVDPYKYERDPNYVTAKALYEKAEDYEREGKPKEFTETYLQALELQKQALKNYRSPEELHFQILPLDILRLIFSFCSTADVSRCMRVSKAWYDITRDGWIWKELFEKTWPSLVSLEDREMPNVNPSIRDWYTLYKHRSLLNATSLRAIVVDESDSTIKFGIVDYGGSELPKPIPHTLVKGADRVSHIRMKIVFRLLEEGPAHNVFFPLDNENRYRYWNFIFQKLGVHSDRHPLLISISPFVSQEYKQDIVDTATLHFHSPAICFQESPILTLYSLNSPQFNPFPAIVITLANTNVAITPVSSERKCLHHLIIADSNLDLIEQNLLQAAQILSKAIDQIPIVLSETSRQATQIVLSFSEKLKNIFQPKILKILSSKDPERANVIGGINFCSLSSFPHLFQTRRIVDLSV